jgi:hypothetical protein
MCQKMRSAETMNFQLAHPAVSACMAATPCPRHSCIDCRSNQHGIDRLWLTTYKNYPILLDVAERPWLHKAGPRHLPSPALPPGGQLQQRKIGCEAARPHPHAPTSEPYKTAAPNIPAMQPSIDKTNPQSKTLRQCTPCTSCTHIADAISTDSTFQRSNIDCQIHEHCHTYCAAER